MTCGYKPLNKPAIRRVISDQISIEVAFSSDALHNGLIHIDFIHEQWHLEFKVQELGQKPARNGVFCQAEAAQNDRYH